MFNIMSDQKREKLRIKLTFVLSVKNKNKQPSKGKVIRDNNIVKKVNNILKKLN
jgi:hypothetical protein